MGRHSRKDSAPPVADTGQQAGAGTRAGAVPEGPPPGTGRRRRETGDAGQGATTQGYGTPAHGTPVYGAPAQGTPQYGAPAPGTPQYGAPAPGASRRGAPAQGAPRHGTPAHGTPRSGAPAQGGTGRGAAGGPRHATPAHGTPVHSGAPGTPARGVPARGAPVRGGHPQHEETSAPRPATYGPRGAAARTAAPEQEGTEAPFVPAPRRGEGADESPEPEAPASRSGLGRAFTGIAAAAIATVLAVVVAGQVTGRGESPAAAHAAGRPDERSVDDSASRSEERPVPAKPVPAVAPPTYEQLMTRQFPIDPKLKGSGEFESVPGLAKAPGKGRLIRYRVDVEKGIGLDPKLFADAVQRTLNDKRSWAGRGEMTFERISSGEPEFVITLASPGTTGAWCAKSGLDTTVDNVSCDSASTQRVMINAFRWAQGSETFGPKAMHAYRQMLINHEVGHRLGHGHVSCRTPGALAPVMQQQTKSLDIDGIKCRPNPWVYPAS
ncbi:hypothetical protein GCM10010275_03420 [Streptomyces litmocidini]|uniref:DUF3152 domain-containing protein n=1 Tax=Streptomyces litmocidini TaxID=67318 RepID=UPI00167ED6C9|nr:DUF3152 domain-containing protein [Streptomyces litmocidini]GGU72253.1 hypothetical protein GCM10010275_03420 [Streptomyces litmocidini]